AGPVLETGLEGPCAAALDEIEHLRGVRAARTQLDQGIVNVALVGEEIGLDRELRPPRGVEPSADRLDRGDRLAQALGGEVVAPALPLDARKAVERFPPLLGGAQLFRESEGRVEFPARRFPLFSQEVRLAAVQVRLHRLAAVV